MKTAIIITGQTRTFRHCFKTLDWCLFRKLPNPHFFVSVADDAQAPDMDLLRQKYDNIEIEYVQQPDHIEEPEGNLDQHAGWGRSAPIQSILKQLWALERGWNFFQRKQCWDGQSPEGQTKFDLIIRCRPDLWCQDIKLPVQLPMFSGEILMPPSTCYTPWWGSFGGVNDRMALMDPLAAHHYFGTFRNRERLWAKGCPLHPETMLRASLEASGVEIRDTWLAEFRICRLPDTHNPKGPYLVQEQLYPHELAKMALAKC